MNILFTSVGRRSYLIKYFKNALKGHGKIFAANSSNLSPAFLEADHTVVTPLIYDDSYISFLLQYCEYNKIDALISLFDIDLPILSQHKKEFEKIGTRVIVSRPEFIEVCNDKWKTYLFLKSNGFNVPTTCLTLGDAVDALNKGDLHFPLIVKPRWGMGSLCVFTADNKTELQVFYKKIKRDIKKTYLKYESNEDIEKSVMIQQKINGQEFGLDVINDLNGEFQNTCVKKKLSMRAGETDSAEIVDSKELKTIGEKIGKLSRHIANLDVDVFISENGTPYVLEMNARFGGGYPFSYLAGVDLPLAIISWLEGKTVSRKMLTPRVGVIAQKDIVPVIIKE